ncbi:MAG: hypothetical protein U5O15_06985 [Candidatus Krumholzibacteriota bacterium]|nr:hypothetical protein [Candidatus Krumholzibacteriota bacterium]
MSEQLAILTEHYPEVTVDSLKTMFKGVSDIAREGIRNEGQQYESYAAITHPRIIVFETD